MSCRSQTFLFAQSAEAVNAAESGTTILHHLCCFSANLVTFLLTMFLVADMMLGDFRTRLFGSEGWSLTSSFSDVRQSTLVTASPLSAAMAAFNELRLPGQVQLPICNVPHVHVSCPVIHFHLSFFAPFSTLLLSDLHTQFESIQETLLLTRKGLVHASSGFESEIDPGDIPDLSK
jgi:hypothetical protein